MKKGLLGILLLFSLTLTGCEFVFDDESTNNNPNHSLYIATKPTKLNYYVDEQFSLAGLKVIDATSGDTITDYTSSIAEGTVLKTVGDQTVTISKESYKSASFNINVSENNNVLEISQMPKTVFEYGEYFSTNGLIVSCNGQKVTGYTVSYRVGQALTESGEMTITISKDGYVSVTYTITVKPQKVLTIAHLPNDVDYETGENFSSTGLVVKDENGNVVTNYTLSIEEGSQLKYAGDVNVEISVTGYNTISFTIHVTENTSLPVRNKDINIYYINDTHGSFIRQIDGTSYEAGMSYISTYIKTEVAKNPDGSLVLSGGDMFQGGLESNVTNGDIMIDAMNEIGFDAMALGNHEFDWGEETLQSICEKLDCPVLSANTFYSNGNRPSYIRPYTIVQKDDVKIGIIGGAQQGMGSSITGSISDNFSFPNPCGYVQSYSDELRMTYNCDLVIAIFHDKGFEGTSGNPTDFASVTQVSNVSHSKYVDAMFFAHDHRVKQGTYNGVPYLEAGRNGGYIGEMTLSLSGTASYAVDDIEVDVKNAYNATRYLTPDANIEALTSKYAEQIGDPDEYIYTFSTSYSSDDFTEVVCRAMHWYVNNNTSSFGGNHVYFASHNTGGIRSDVESGTFTRRDLIKVFPFDNNLTIQTCSSTNINKMRESTYYRTYEENEIVYSGGYTKAVSITYISEYKYAYNYQQSYVKYNMTAKDALVAFLTSDYGISLHL